TVHASRGHWLSHEHDERIGSYASAYRSWRRRSSSVMSAAFAPRRPWLSPNQRRHTCTTSFSEGAERSQSPERAVLGTLPRPLRPGSVSTFRCLTSEVGDDGRDAVVAFPHGEERNAYRVPHLPSLRSDVRAGTPPRRPGDHLGAR